MSQFDFGHVETKFPSFNQYKSFIWIWNADKIPPHIGFSVGEHYMSLTYKKVESALVQSMVRKIKRTKIPVVFVELNDEYSVDEMKQVMSGFDKASLKATCLAPVKRLLKGDSTINKLADLLHYLSNDKRIEAFYGVNLPLNYQFLPNYTLDDIFLRISELSSENSH